MQEKNNEGSKINEIHLIKENYFINNNHKFKFNQEPLFMRYFKLNKGNELNNDNHIPLSQIKHSFKIGGYKMNKVLASFWFGAFLFAMQSYFLRQNLKLTDVKFISE